MQHLCLFVCFQSDSSFGLAAQKPAGSSITSKSSPCSLFGWAPATPFGKTVALSWAHRGRVSAAGLAHLTACDVVRIKFLGKRAPHFIGWGFDYLTM